MECRHRSINIVQKIFHMKRLLITFSGLLSCGSLFAHEGHGHGDGYAIIHYLTEPVHALSVLIAFVTGILLWKYSRKEVFKK